MGKGKKVTIGYRYRLGFHLVLCQGGADAITRIRYEDRVAWTGNVTGNQTVTINQPNLFGGDKKQGGLQGKVDFMFGGESQPVNSYLAYQSNKGVIPTYLDQYNFVGGEEGWISASGGGNSDIVANGGIPVPAYRGVVSLLFKKFMYGAMNPYMKPFRVTVRRIPKTLGITNATITIDGRDNANPAHMIYDILTNKQWGQGIETGDINVTSFTTAAATLASEGFGLSMLWKQESTADDFINLILSHISGTLYPDPSTGQYTLKLIRGGYNVSTLTELNESNILALRSFQRVSTNDLTNELTVEYYEPETEQEAKITVQNLATIRSVGKIVRRVIEYPGIRNADLAARVAQRDLLAFSTPLAKLSIETNLSAWNLRPGDVFKFSWAKLGISSLVFRILEIEYGGLRDNKIVITAVEDIFSVPSASYIGSQPPISTPVASSLADISTFKIFDTPYYSLIQYFGEDYSASLADNRNFVSVIAPRPNGLWTDFKLHELLSGSYVEREAGTFSPFVSLSSSITQLQTVVTYTGYFDIELVTFPVLGVIDNEWVYVAEINTTNKTLVLVRGVLDSIPATHSANALIYLYGENFLLDESTERFASENVTYKFQPRTGSGELALANASARAYTVNGRQERPYPPGNVRIANQYYISEVDDDFTVTWAHRDRTLQTAVPVSWTDGNIGPESSITYTLEIRRPIGDTLIHSQTGLTGTSVTLGDTQLGSETDLKLNLWTVRGSVSSFQTFTHTFIRNLSGEDYVVRVFADSPVGYWRLGDLLGSATAKDSSGNGFDGTSTSVTFGQTGLVANSIKNKSALFNGTSSRVSVAHTSALAPTSFVTVETWINVNSFTSFQSIVSKTQAGGYAISLANVSPSNTYALNFTVRRNSAFGSAFYPVSSLNAGEVYHVIGVYDGRYARLYLDGVQVAVDDAGASYPIQYTVSNSLQIGAEASSTTEPEGDYFNGKLDEVSIYNTAITAQNALARFKTGVGRHGYREDPFYDKVVLLLDMDGANGSQVFTDAKGKTVTAAGNAQISTTTPKFGAGCGLFDGTGDYLSVPNSSDFDFGAGDFSIEMWIRPDSVSGFRTLFVKRAANTDYSPVALSINSGQLGIYVSTTGTSWVQAAGGTISASVYSHVAMCRKGSVVYGFVNGISVASMVVTGALMTNTSAVLIGGDTNTSYFQGRIDDVRVTKGVGRYKKDFSPAVLANPKQGCLPDTIDPFWDDTTLLLHMDGANGSTVFTDMKGKAVSRFGAQISTTQAKFGGASGYFDGASSTYLSVASTDFNMLNSDFTVEAWFYPTDSAGLGTTRTIFHMNAGSFQGLHVHRNNSGFLVVDNGTTGTTAGTISVPLNTWTHIAVTRVGSLIRGYVNGVNCLQHPVQTYGSPTTLQIGRYASGATVGNLMGYLDEVRITKGIARYLRDFIPSKLPHPDSGLTGLISGSGGLVAQSATVSGTGSVTDVPNVITGTGVLAAAAATVAGTGAAANIVLQLRMDGTNGSTTFIDDTGKTVTAVNSAQISTAQTKHGSAVGSFPGGDAYLRVPASTDFDFGTGDFTVECWAYFTGTTTWRITNRNEWGAFSGSWGFNVSPDTGGFSFSEVISGEPKIEATGLSLPTNTWTHFAAARSGTTLRLFVNGTQVASGAFTNSLSSSAWDLKVGISSPGVSLNGYLDDVRIAKGTAIYTANFTPPGPFANSVITGTGALSAQSATTSGTGSVANVVLLLRMNGANGSTTFTDETGKIVSRYGNAQISTAQSPSGSGSSGLFDGNGDYLTVAESADFDLGAGDYTVEAWVYPTSSNAMAIDTRTAPTNTVGAMIWGLDPGVRVVVYRYPTAYAFTDLVPPLNAWSHVAIVRQAGVLKAFLNGVQSATTHAFAFAVSTTTMTVGTNINNRIGENIATSWPQGHIDDVRIVKDTAMYTDTFVPPPPFGTTNVVTGAGAMASGSPTGNRTTTTGWAHTGDPDLSLSMQGSNGSTVFTDTSPNALAFTVNGNAQISTAESPFAGGSSGAFDGNGDFLSLTNVPAALRLDTTDFTIEFWVRTSSTGTQAILGNLNDNLGTGHYWVMLNSTYIALHTLQFGYEGTAHRFGTTTLPLNQWVHFALVRSTNSLKCYQNGVQIGSIGSMSSNFTGTTSNPFRIGAANPGTSGNSYFLNGYLAGVRITKAEVYRGSFTPTGPFA